MKTEVVEHKNSAGNAYLVERMEREMLVKELPAHMDFKEGCGPCEMRGRNLACPPHSPYVLDYIDGATRTLAICFRVPMEQFSNLIPEDAYNNAYELVRDMLYDELLAWREKGFLVAGSGPCHACKTCVIEEGVNECRFPEKRIYSLESMGVSVVQFSERAFGISLDWSGNDTSAETVTALGAVFME